MLAGTNLALTCSCCHATHAALPPCRLPLDDPAFRACITSTIPDFNGTLPRPLPEATVACLNASGRLQPPRNETRPANGTRPRDDAPRNNNGTRPLNGTEAPRFPQAVLACLQSLDPAFDPATSTVPVPLPQAVVDCVKASAPPRPEPAANSTRPAPGNGTAGGSRQRGDQQQRGGRRLLL